MTEFMETTTETTTETIPTARRPGRLLPVIGVVIAALCLVAAGVFVLSATSDRDDAANARRDAAAHLRVQRARADRAQAHLSDLQTTHREALVQVDGFLSEMDAMVTLADRQVVLETSLQDAGANNSTARVDEYNDLVSRSNEVVDQYNARVDALEKRIKAAFPGTTVSA